jgi:hypothetical protein
VRVTGGPPRSAVRPVVWSDLLARCVAMPLRGDDVARHPLRRIEARARHELPVRAYPAAIPAVATAFGLSPEGASTRSRHSTRCSTR